MKVSFLLYGLSLIYLCKGKIEYSYKSMNSTFENYKKLKQKINQVYMPVGDGEIKLAYLNGTDEGFERMDAKSVDVDGDIEYLLYTKENNDTPCYFERDDIDSLMKCEFDPEKETKIVVHGWLGDSSTQACQVIKNNFLIYNDMNVIIVNWEKYSKYLIYFRAKYYVSKVGINLAQTIDFLIDYGLQLHNVHLIGHSLGAHVCGIAGHYVQSGKVSRITGLDPALPGFYYANLKYRLDKNDAQFVDVMHTCGWLLGFGSDLGHVDVYPNSGRPAQPGCFKVKKLMEACSHARSYEYYAESINPDVYFFAVQCDNWSSFKQNKCSKNKTSVGYKISNKVRGDYFLYTNEEKPFSRGENFHNPN